MMMRYPKPLRILHPKIDLHPNKRYLSDADVKKLLRGKVYIEEKLDGSHLGFEIKGGKPVTFTTNQHLWESDKRHEFNGVLQWLWENYDKIVKIPKGHRMCGEWLKVQHHIHYNDLPDWFIAYDVIDVRKREFLSYKEKTKVISKCGFHQAVLLGEGMYYKDDLYDIAMNQSNYGEENMEGVVVKRDKFETLGKLVMQEFLDGIVDEHHHWSSPRQKLNKLSDKVIRSKEDEPDNTGKASGVLV